jgi:hypothetical protein
VDYWVKIEGNPDPSVILKNHLYLSGCSTVVNADLLQTYNIKYIINAAHDVCRSF